MPGAISTSVRQLGTCLFLTLHLERKLIAHSYLDLGTILNTLNPLPHRRLLTLLQTEQIQIRQFYKSCLGLLCLPMIEI